MLSHQPAKPADGGGVKSRVGCLGVEAQQGQRVIESDEPGRRVRGIHPHPASLLDAYLEAWDARARSMPAFAFLVSGVDLAQGRAALLAAGASVPGSTGSTTLPVGGGTLNPPDTLVGTIEAASEEEAIANLEDALPDDGFQVIDVHPSG
jgi:hypothetical protein